MAEEWGKSLSLYVLDRSGSITQTKAKLETGGQVYVKLPAKRLFSLDLSEND